MTDLFDEVEEQLRSDRIKASLLKATPWITAVAVALILAAGGIYGWRYFQAKAIAEASETYGEALEALNGENKALAERKFAEVAKSGPRGYKSLALMQQAGLRLADGKTKEAVALLDQAAEAAPNDVIGDAARLKAALALLDTTPFKEMATRLNPLMETGRPYHVEAREALAFAKLMAGDLAGARGEFVVLSLLSDAAEPVQRRADAAIVLIDSGAAKAIPGVVKAATALPQAPPMPSPPASPPAAQQTPVPQ